MPLLFQDLRCALRQLRKRPGLTAVVMSTLALGVGANTAIFTIVDWFLLRPLPVSNLAELTYLAFQQKGQNGWNNGASYMDLEDIRTAASSVFADIAGAQGSTDGLTVDGKTEPMSTEFVTGNFFPTMGVKPELGRLILPAEGKAAGVDPVLVLSHLFWRTHFGADSSIAGKKAQVKRAPYPQLRKRSF
jgi:hypothetical protein